MALKKGNRFTLKSLKAFCHKYHKKCEVLKITTTIKKNVRTTIITMGIQLRRLQKSICIIFIYRKHVLDFYKR